MTEAIVSGGTVAPVVAAEPAAVVAPVVAAAAVAPEAEPSWLKARLEQAERAGHSKLLAELGADSKTAAKAALDAAKARTEAEKTAQQKLDEITPKTTRLENVTREFAGRMLGALTAEQQEAVRSFAPDTDPTGQLDAITKLGPVWAAAEKAARPAVAAAPVVVPAATTAPGNTAPAGGGTTSTPDHKSVYQVTRAKNPFAAAAYGLEHASSVYTPKT